MNIDVDLVANDNDDDTATENLKTNAADDAEEDDEGVSQYVVHRWTSAHKSDIAQIIYRQHNRMSLLQGWYVIPV